eukprot:4151039-Lingulodinium_polyedra.AAC.1
MDGGQTRPQQSWPVFVALTKGIRGSSDEMHPWQQGYAVVPQRRSVVQGDSGAFCKRCRGFGHALRGSDSSAGRALRAGERLFLFPPDENMRALRA